MMKNRIALIFLVTFSFSQLKAQELGTVDYEAAEQYIIECSRDWAESVVTGDSTLDNVEVRFFGDTAVAHGDETWVKKDGTTGRYVWTDIWVRRNGEWQIVAAQDAAASVNE